MKAKQNTHKQEIQYLRAQVASLTADAVRNGKLHKRAVKKSFTVERLIKAAIELNQIVEGVESVRWAFDGRRFKDTKAWCEFYCALAELRRNQKDEVAK